MADRKLRFRIGVFVLLAFVVLAVLMSLFGLFPHLFSFKGGTRFTVAFTDAPNLTVNTPVRRSGVKIGQVEKVVLEEDTGLVIVTMRIDKNYTLRANEEPTVTSGLFSSDTVIDLIPRERKPGEPEDRSPVEPGSRLDGKISASVGTLINRASAVVPSAQEALARMQISLERFERMAPKIEDAVDEYRKLAADVRRGVPEFRETARAMQKLAKDVNEIVPDARKFVQRANETMPDVQKLVKGLADTLPDVQALVKGIKDYVPELRMLTRGLNDTVPDLQATMKGIKETVPEVQKLVKGINTAVPDFQAVMKGIKDTVPEVQKMVKGINDAIPEAQKLLKGANETVPLVQGAIKDAGVAMRNWSMLGERINVLIATNEKSLNAIVDNLNDALRGAAKVFNADNVNDFMTILKNTKTASQRFPGIADETELLLRQGRGTLNNINEATKKLNEILDVLYKSAKPDSPEAKGILKDLAESLEKLNRTMTDVQEIVRAGARSDGTLRRLIADPALYNHLDDAALMAARILPRLDRVLKDVEVFADKIARHPESIGLGGVVRPNSGIKDPPRSSIGPRVP